MRWTHRIWSGDGNQLDSRFLRPWLQQRPQLRLAFQDHSRGLGTQARPREIAQIEERIPKALLYMNEQRPAREGPPIPPRRGNARRHAAMVR